MDNIIRDNDFKERGMVINKPSYDDLVRRIESLEQEVTKARHTQEELEESEHKFRILANSTPIAVLIFQDDEWIFVNRAAEAITGYSEEQLLNKNIWEIIHPDYRDLARNPGQKRQKEDPTVNRHELKIITADGTEKWVNVTGATTIIGKRKAGVVSLIDIDDYKRAENAVKASEERFRRLFNNAVEGVYYTTPDGRLLDANIAFAKMFRYNSTSEAIKDLTDIANRLYVDPNDRKEALDILIRKGYVNNFECRLRRKDGTIFWAVLNARLAEFDDGTPCIQGFIANITKRKHVEEVLRESEEKFRLLVENAPEGIFVQTDGKFAYVNRAAMKMFGATYRDRIIGDAVLSRMHPDCRDAVRERIKNLNEKPKEASLIEEQYLRLDGTPFDVEVSTVPFIYENENGAIVFFRDITRRKRAEEERERLVGQLQEALAKVKLLSGFLPICAWCKKIRDDKGYWNQIEKYLKDHSEAEFSHSICPECMEKLKARKLSPE
ncbi:MAG: PAS domain S-box protein [Syntrophorhabdus sp.]